MNEYSYLEDNEDPPITLSKYLDALERRVERIEDYLNFPSEEYVNE